jgi:hypothetical protein
MPHYINAFIGYSNRINNLVETMEGEQVQLSQGISLFVPPKEFFDDNDFNIYLTYEDIAMKIIDVLKEHSFNSKLAYIETLYHGGTGLQAAILYENGKQKIQAIFTLDYLNSEPTPSEERAINKVLKELGVNKIANQDEFDSIGLRNY